MHRRALLVAVASGALGGCLSTVTPGDTPGSVETTMSDPTSSSRSSNGQYVVTDYSVTTEKPAPTTKYVLDTTKHYSEDAAREEVDASDIADVADLEPDVRDAIETAVEGRGWKTDEIPDGLRETLDRYEFFTGIVASDRTHTHFALELYELSPDAPPQVTFDTKLRDADVTADDPGIVEFSVTNDGETTRRIFSGTVPPFGVVRAEATDSDRRFLLWRDYEEEGCVTVEDGRVRAVCDIGKMTPIEPGQTISREYELRTGTPGTTPGEYEIRGTVSHSAETGGPSEKVEWVASFTLQK